MLSKNFWNSAYVYARMKIIKGEAGEHLKSAK